MKTAYKMVLFLSILILISCDKKDELSFFDSEYLYGYWINPVINDSISIFEKSNSLKDNDYGFVFKSEHVFIERKNSGWCGTPPISYANFEGTWDLTDSIIDITVGYWGGLADYQWKIISIDKNKLKIIRLKEDYHLEN
jgi:hypothetical protein